MQVLSYERNTTEGGTLRRLLLAALCMAATLVLSAPVMAQQRGPSGADGTFNCEDFDFQEDAQAVFDEDPSDPNGLDGPVGPAFDGEEGVACEDLPSRGGGGMGGGGMDDDDDMTDPTDEQYGVDDDQYDTGASETDPSTVSPVADTTVSPTADTDTVVLPDTGGVVSPAALSVVAALLLVGGGIMSASIARRK